MIANELRMVGGRLFDQNGPILQPRYVWLAPIFGATLAGVLTKWLYEREGIVDTVIVENRASS